MTESAIGARARRRARTQRDLIRSARRLTVERGLNGFTVEDVCDAVDISRRTFFNYFASKDDAVLGLPIERGDSDAIAAFLAGGERQAGAVSRTLLADLMALVIVRWECMDVGPSLVADLSDVFEREPRLLKKFLESGIEDEQRDAELIEQREQLAPGDLRAQAVTQMVGAVARAAAVEVLAPESNELFADVFLRRLQAAQSVFTHQDPLGRTTT